MIVKWPRSYLGGDWEYICDAATRIPETQADRSVPPSTAAKVPVHIGAPTPTMREKKRRAEQKARAREAERRRCEAEKAAPGGGGSGRDEEDDFDSHVPAGHRLANAGE